MRGASSRLRQLRRRVVVTAEPRSGSISARRSGSRTGTPRVGDAATEILNQARNAGLEVRAGVHTGEVEVRPDDVVGLAVTIAERICDLAGPAAVLVSEGVKGHLVGSSIALSERGLHVLKGVPDDWRLYAIEGWLTERAEKTRYTVEEIAKAAVERLLRFD